MEWSSWILKKPLLVLLSESNKNFECPLQNQETQIEWSTVKATLKLYYAIKRAVPRAIQVRLRAIRAKRIYAGLDDVVCGSLDALRPSTSRWPEGARSVALLTHDIESAVGLNRLAELRDIERSYDLPSNWNFVLDKYGNLDEPIAALTEDNCECGAHGLYHDGLLFCSHGLYKKRMERIRAISREYGLVGFRSPSLHRNEMWMKRLPFVWDSSFPAWDPFQPQPGGCRKYTPYRLGEDVLELPITMWQDFTVFLELGHRDISIWARQVDSLYAHGALINIITHPDYLGQFKLAEAYAKLLDYLIGLRDLIVLRPRDLSNAYLNRMSLE